MDILKRTTLEKANGEQVSGETALAKKKVVGIYFSAHWCPPCRGFTPVLKEWYEAMQEMGCELEIVFVSSDDSAADMKAYMNESHGDWLGVPHESAAVQELNTKFEVTGIPTLVFLRQDGSVADAEGREVVAKQGPTKAVFDKLAGN